MIVDNRGTFYFDIETPNCTFCTFMKSFLITYLCIGCQFCKLRKKACETINCSLLISMCQVSNLTKKQTAVLFTCINKVGVFYTDLDKTY